MHASDLFARPIDRRTFTIGSAIALAALGTVRAAPAVLAQSYGGLPELTLVAKDYSFTLPANIASGFTTVTLDNQGKDFHHAIFLKLNAGATVDQVKAAKDEGAVFGLGTSIGGPMSGPGGKETVAMNLEEGNYAILCIIPGPDGMPHFKMGMIAPLSVTAGTSTATAPTADLKIALEEMTFKGLPSSLAAGKTTWEVTNAGTVPHEMIVFKLDKGVTGKDVLTMILGPAPGATPEATPVIAASGPPPFSLVGVAAPMGVGHTVYPELMLEAGDYFAACLVFDAAAGMPHALMGMQMSFTVA